MNPDVKDIWTNALESNTYAQTKNYLHTDDGFCCLGVLCDLYAQRHPGFSWAKQESDEPFYDFADTDSITSLPLVVQEWAGLSESDPLIHRPRGSEENVTLAFLNDNGKAFPEIAKIIRECL